MSKMDNLRAMREARYESTRAQARLRGASAAAVPAPPVAPRTVPPREVTPPAAEAESPPAAAGDTGLCGHRSMNGRSCTREHGHAAKSHRYS
jgi:hypothetical protein